MNFNRLAALIIAVLVLTASPRIAKSEEANVNPIQTTLSSTTISSYVYVDAPVSWTGDTYVATEPAFFTRWWRSLRGWLKINGWHR